VDDIRTVPHFRKRKLRGIPIKKYDSGLGKFE
jgi:hypothetical protein